MAANPADPAETPYLRKQGDMMGVRAAQRLATHRISRGFSVRQGALLGSMAVDENQGTAVN